MCDWLGSHPFRIYRSLFRENYVDGKMLITLTEDDLKSMPIVNAMHRRRILNAIEDEKTKVVRKVETDGESEARAGYDVFLSYRRQGGSDFAQLLKVQLEGEPYKMVRGGYGAALAYP